MRTYIITITLGETRRSINVSAMTPSQAISVAKMQATAQELRNATFELDA
jgi:hypothetical protein